LFFGVFGIAETQLWEKSSQPNVALSLTMQFVNQWKNSNTINHQQQSSPETTMLTTWSPPSRNQVECNVDAAIFEDVKQFGAGLCLRDEKGNFLKAFTATTTGVPTPREAEAWALHQAINWTHHLGMQNVIFELDCKLVVDNMVNNKKGSTEFHAILHRCRAILSNSPNSRMSFEKRQANLITHNLARASRFYVNSCF